MSEHTKKVMDGSTVEMTEQTVSENLPEVPKTDAMTENVSDKFTMDYCLAQIDKIQTQAEYLNQIISELRQMGTSGGAAGFADSQKAQALVDVVKCRETTNQALLTFYMKMYDDLKPRTSLKEHSLMVLETAVKSGSMTDETLERLSEVFDTIRHIG